MIRFILAILLIATPALAVPLNVNITYDLDQTSGSGTYGATADRSWQTFDPDDETASGGTNGPLPIAPHLTAVEVDVNGNSAISIIDNPADRTISVTIDGTTPRPRITLRTVALWAPWRASTIYNVGDKIFAFRRDVLHAADYTPQLPGDVTLPVAASSSYYWICTRAGTSGSVEPSWPGRIKLTDGYRNFLDNKKLSLGWSVVDNGGGTVNLPLTTSSSFVAGDQVTITGTVNYNGIYTIPDQTHGDLNNIEITHTYIAETFTAGTIYLTAADVTDNGDGTVTLPVPGHGFSAGDNVTIIGTTNYDGAYILSAQTLGDADHLVITASYVAETVSSSANVYPTNGNVIDNGAGTVNIPAATHGLAAGDVIDVSGTINYDGVYTLPVQTYGDANNIEITAAYTAETINSHGQVIKRVQDPYTSGAEWQFILSASEVNSWASTSTGRIIVKDNGTGQAIRTGATYILRASP